MYLLEFPPSMMPLPSGVNGPPYVMFGINSQDCTSLLPTDVPLRLVLHFAPALKKWILPQPEILSQRAIRMSLTTPHVGINILASIDATGLAWILVRMLQIANLSVDKKFFIFDPSLSVSIAIQQAWLALELPLEGLASLHVHMQMSLMYGMPVVFPEMRALWSMFPPASPVIQAMGDNFVQSHLAKSYTQPEFSAIRNWYLADLERYRFFIPLEKRDPSFGKIQDEMIADIVAEKVKADAAAQEAAKTPMRIRRKKKLDEATASVQDTTILSSAKYEGRERRREERRQSDLTKSYSQPIDSVALMNAIAQERSFRDEE
ncbi:unnamed protein product [Periconia digitata]|uniref:Uncharacterized protein n=1 Tax=Periconia digitata TaxID=1303443 RepID=A0A9W4XMG3_9PLEO|nr:unnamed protein product [Periconia digitata]